MLQHQQAVMCAGLDMLEAQKQKAGAQFEAA